MIGHVILIIPPTALCITVAIVMVVISSTISSGHFSDNGNESHYQGRNNGDQNVTTKQVVNFAANDENNDSAAVVSPVENGSQRSRPNELVQYGVVLGDICSDHCSDNLTNVICNKTTGRCECELMHPVQLDEFICIAALHLGDICNHEESCVYHDPNAECWQESPYYSKCACKSTYMAVDSRDTVTGLVIGRRKCVRDPYTQVHYDLSEILGIGFGISLFTGVTCFVLKLFSRARFGDHGGHYADANQSPPMLMTPVSGPPSRRSSGRSSSSRRQSNYYTTLGQLSRPGSRHPSMVSLRSQTSVHSYVYTNRYDGGHHHHHPHHGHHHNEQHGAGHAHQHEPLRATSSAPLSGGNGRFEDLGSPSTSSISSMRMLEQRFAQHSGYHPRREDREASRHSSQEIITEVISELPEKSYK